MDFSLQEKHNGLNKSDGGSFPAPQLKSASTNYKTDESSTKQQFTQASQVTSTNSNGFSSKQTSLYLKNKNLTNNTSSSSKIRKHSLEQKTSTRSNSASDDGATGAYKDEVVGEKNNAQNSEVNPRGTLTYQDRSDGVGQRGSDSLAGTSRLIMKVNYKTRLSKHKKHKQNIWIDFGRFYWYPFSILYFIKRSFYEVTDQLWMAGLWPRS